MRLFDSRYMQHTLSDRTKLEGDFPGIKAWRLAHSTMGLKPTRYRLAFEALLCWLRKEGALPSLQPLIGMCNADSVAHALSVVVFDREQIDGDLAVRQTTGQELYLAFSGAGFLSRKEREDHHVD